MQAPTAPATVRVGVVPRDLHDGVRRFACSGAIVEFTIDLESGCRLVSRLWRIESVLESLQDTHVLERVGTVPQVRISGTGNDRVPNRSHFRGKSGAASNAARKHLRARTLPVLVLKQVCLQSVSSRTTRARSDSRHSLEVLGRLLARSLARCHLARSLARASAPRPLHRAHSPVSSRTCLHTL